MAGKFSGKGRNDCCQVLRGYAILGGNRTLACVRGPVWGAPAGRLVQPGLAEEAFSSLSCCSLSVGRHSFCSIMASLGESIKIRWLLLDRLQATDSLKAWTDVSGRLQTQKQDTAWPLGEHGHHAASNEVAAGGRQLGGQHLLSWRGMLSTG